MLERGALGSIAKLASDQARLQVLRQGGHGPPTAGKDRSSECAVDADSARQCNSERLRRTLEEFTFGEVVHRECASRTVCLWRHVFLPIRLQRDASTFCTEHAQREHRDRRNAPSKNPTQPRDADHSVTAAHESTSVGLAGVGTCMSICLVDVPPDP